MYMPMRLKVELIGRLNENGFIRSLIQFVVGNGINSQLIILNSPFITYICSPFRRKLLMANTKNAKKAQRQADKRRLDNRLHAKTTRNMIKKVRTADSASD